jgi:arylsulfatase
MQSTVSDAPRRRRVVVTSPSEIVESVQLDADRQERSTGGTVSLYANRQRIGDGRLEATVGVRFSAYAGMDIGLDNGLPADRTYADRSLYPFTGTLKRVVFDLSPATHDDEQALHEAAARGSAVHGISTMTWLSAGSARSRNPPATRTGQSASS